MTENDMRMVFVEQVIICWFVIFASFRGKWLKLLTIILLSGIEGKQEQNDRKLCAKDVGEKWSYLVLVSIFGSSSC